MGFLDRIERLLREPFTREGDMIDFFLAVGLATAAAFLWSRVIRQIAE